jgi:hypothetical protein
VKTLSSPPPGWPERRWWTRTLAINAALVLVVFGAIQLVPVNRSNPQVRREPVWDSPETEALVKGACFDCHSNLTRWPWYGKIAPASWVLWYDVTQARKHLNFTEWDRFTHAEYVDPNDPFPPKTLTERIAEVLTSGRMPLGIYRIAHSQARLTPEQRDALLAGLIRTVKQNQEPP